MKSIKKLKVKKIKISSRRSKAMVLSLFMVAFAGIGGIIVIISRAAPGGCTVPAPGALGTATYTVTAPETAEYRVLVRMQVPDTVNTGNVNGIKLELAGNSTQCFTVTTTNANAVNNWQWVSTDAAFPNTQHVTSQLTAGNYTAKILGLKAGVKVDKVLLLKSDNNCTPSNDFSSGQPGDNCTTPAPTVTMSAASTTVNSGSSTNITWSTTNATACTAGGSTGWTGSRTASGGTLTSGPLTSNATLTLSCTGPGGSANASVAITVVPTPAPTVNFSASPTQVVTGTASTLTWTTQNATTCTGSGVSGWTGSKLVNGSQSTGNLTANRTYTLSCNGPGGTTERTATVTVTANPGNDTTAPTVQLNVQNVTIAPTDTSVVVKNLKSINWQPLASDTSGIRTLVLTVNGQEVSLSGGSYIFGNQAGGNGDYLIKMVATDNANNTATAEVTIKLRHPDFNRSGRVDIFDLSTMLGMWGSTNNIGYDIDARGSIDIFDLSYLLGQWNSTL